MTVCVAIKVHDCIVFAADSASSLVGGSQVYNIWEHGIKVFNLHRKLPIVAMTAGIGHFGPASISNLTKDLRLKLSKDPNQALDICDYTIEQVANSAQEFFADKYNAIDPSLGTPQLFEFWIGGYGSDGTRGEIWKLSIYDGNFQPLRQIAKAEEDEKLEWGGQRTAINRLVFGFDASQFERLEKLGLSEEDLFELVQNTITPLVHPAMPVQDAINLADFLVDVTKRYFSFLPNANIVAGETDIATVTKHEGFKWIKRKHYYPQHLNRRGTDHVE